MSQTITLNKNLLPTAKMEKWMVQVKEAIVRYRRIEKSPELKEFRDLQKVVESKAFQENKHYLLTRKYKDTEEYRKEERLYKLHNYTLAVWQYRWSAPRVAGLDDYFKFAASEEYALLRDKKAVKESEELRRFRKIDRSLPMRVYRHCVERSEVNEYIALNDEFEMEEFQSRRAFWKNSKRWYTTPESQQDARYTALRDSEDIRFFVSQDEAQIAEWERYTLALDDDFAGSSWQNGNWEAGFYYSNPALKCDHSYVNEQQANNHGKNAIVSESALRVELRKEQCTASAWHPTKGFIPQAYNYTGDVLQTGKHFQQAEGLFMAKVRFSGKAHAAVYLGTGTRLPLVTLAQWDGKQVHLGVRTEKESTQTEIVGLKAGRWMIYSVLVTKKEIVWYVNDQEVLRLPNRLEGASLYPAVATYLPSGSKPGTGKAEVDWVKAYQYLNA